MTAEEYRKLLEVEFDEVKLDDMPDLAKIRIEICFRRRKDRNSIRRITKLGNTYKR